MTLSDTIHYKMQLLPFALKLDNNYTVNDLIKNTDKLFKYVIREEYTEDYSDKFYEKCGLTSPKSNPDYDKGFVESSYEKYDPVPKKCLDIELDCKDIKFEKCDTKCDCITECKAEEVKPWNTEAFKKEFADFSATIIALATSGALKLHGNNFDQALKQWPLFKQFHDKIMKCVPEKEREEHYKILSERIGKSVDDFKNSKTPLDKWEPVEFISLNNAVNSNHTPLNKEREVYKKQVKQIADLDKDYFSGEARLRAICDEHYASITNPKSVIPKKQFSYFDEWCKEREQKLSQPEEKQLLLNI